MKDYIINILSESFSSYIITLILTKGSLFNKYRQQLINILPQLQMPPMQGESGPPHFITCRLCVGFWISTLVCLINADIYNILFVYGLSYFLATQER